MRAFLYPKSCFFRCVVPGSHTHTHTISPFGRRRPASSLCMRCEQSATLTWIEPMAAPPLLLLNLVQQRKCFTSDRNNNCEWLRRTSLRRFCDCQQGSRHKLTGYPKSACWITSTTTIFGTNLYTSTSRSLTRRPPLESHSNGSLTTNLTLQNPAASNWRRRYPMDVIHAALMSNRLPN